MELISEHPDWFKESFLDIAEDVNQAAESGRHVILFMHLNDCPYCHRMIEENFKHAPYTDFIKENFDVIQLNIKGDREIAFNAETSVSEKELACPAQGALHAHRHFSQRRQQDGAASERLPVGA